MAPVVVQRQWSQAAVVPAASCDAHSLLQQQDCVVEQGLGRKGAMYERGYEREDDAGDGMRKAGQCQLELCGRPE